MYRLFIPGQTVGANVVFFDIWNPSGSGLNLEVLHVSPLVSGAAAVVGVVAVDMFLTRTTAIGTGGTAATYEGTSLSAMTFTHCAGSQPLSSTITARLTPSGGATAGSVISWRSVFTEETNSAAYSIETDLARLGNSDQPGILVPQGSGIRVVQGSVASVGVIGFDVLLRTITR